MPEHSCANTGLHWCERNLSWRTIILISVDRAQSEVVVVPEHSFAGPILGVEEVEQGCAPEHSVLWSNPTGGDGAVQFRALRRVYNTGAARVEPRRGTAAGIEFDGFLDTAMVHKQREMVGEVASRGEPADHLRKLKNDLRSLSTLRVTVSYRSAPRAQRASAQRSERSERSVAARVAALEEREVAISNPEGTDRYKQGWTADSPRQWGG